MTTKSVDLRTSGASSWPATPAPARRRSPSTSCSRPGPSRAWAGSMTAPRALDFEPEEQKRRESLSARRRHARRRRHDRHPDRHARLPGLRRRGRSRASPPCDGALFVMDAVRRRRGGPRDRRRPGPDVRTGGLLLHQQVRSRERRPDARPWTRSARDVRQQDRAAPPGHRRGRDVQRLRRSRPSQGLAVGRQAGSRDPDPGRARGRGRPPARPAARGRRRGRRRRAGQVPRRRGDLRPGARGLPPQGRQGVDPRAGPRRQCRPRASACAGCSTRSSATCPRPPTSRRSSPASRSPATRSRSRPIRPGRSSSGCSRRPPTRSSAGSPTSASTRARSASSDHVWNAKRGEDERIGQLLLLHGKEQEPVGELKAGEIGAVAKLGRDRDRRHAHREGEAARPARHRLPGADAAGRHRAADQGRPRQDGRRPASGCSRRSRALRVERRPDRRAAPGRPGRGPHRGHRRAAQAQVRGRRS